MFNIVRFGLSPHGFVFGSLLKSLKLFLDMIIYFFQLLPGPRCGMSLPITLLLFWFCVISACTLQLASLGSGILNKKVIYTHAHMSKLFFKFRPHIMTSRDHLRANEISQSQIYLFSNRIWNKYLNKKVKVCEK